MSEISGKAADWNRPSRPHRPASLVVLEALLMGIPVKMDGEEWYYREGVFGIARLRQTVAQLGTNQGEHVLLGVEYDLPGFIRACDRIPPKDLLELETNIAFNRVRQDQAKSRPERIL